MKIKYISIVILLMILFISYVHAENIKNYGDCDVCPGTLHYEADEARKIINAEGLKFIQHINKAKPMIIKLDMDGVLKNGTANDDNMGYEIEINSFHNIIYIKSLVDQSYIQIVTDEANVNSSGFLNDWSPEIYLQSSHSDTINLKDSVKSAWEKMETSHIYSWVFSEKTYINKLDLLGNKIRNALKLLIENKS